jgi:predicted Zn-ribbon and HTH transcriptional regulator
MDCQSGKVIHTLKTAKAASKRARHRTELPLTPYRCNECGQWHGGLKRPVTLIAKKAIPAVSITY